MLTAVTHYTFIRDVECLILSSVKPRLLRTPYRITIRDYYLVLFQEMFLNNPRIMLLEAETRELL
jgi:hypothetical protein